VKTRSGFLSIFTTDYSFTVGVPGSPADLARWLRGGFMSGDL